MANISDKSNGYERVASTYISGRGQSRYGVGVNTVTEWSQQLPTGAAVLDLGCGAGLPISAALVERGFQVYGVDASAAMIAAFRSRFPSTPVQCAAAEESDFFCRMFDAVVAWGLLFLLTPETQRSLIKRIAGATSRGGKLLFTSPRMACDWLDAMTGERSFSLGLDEYQNALEANGMSLTGTQLDEGENHYYFAEKKKL